MENIKFSDSELDVGECFDEALEIFKSNALPLIIATVLFVILSVFSLLILCGPLWGGICFMLLNCYRSENNSVKVGDMFGVMTMFWSLLFLFFIQLILLSIGIVLLVIPMLILNCLFLYSELFMVDYNLGVIASLKTSMQLVKQKGFVINFLVSIIFLALVYGPALIPHVGWIINFLTLPLAALIITSAFLQQVQKVEKPFGEKSVQGDM